MSALAEQLERLVVALDAFARLCALVNLRLKTHACRVIIGAGFDMVAGVKYGVFAFWLGCARLGSRAGYSLSRVVSAQGQHFALRRMPS